MKVAHVIDSGGFYGAEVMLLTLCIAQKKLGMDVEVISIGLLSEQSKPVEIKLIESNINVKTWRMHALPDLRESLKMIAYCKDQGINIIHSHGYKGNILFGLLPKFLRKIPIVSTIHGYTKTKGLSKLSLNQWLDKKCLANLDAIVLVSPSMKQQVPITTFQHKMHIVENGIPDLTMINSTSPYCSLFAEEDFKIGALGRLSYEKNFSLLINAMPKILKNIPNAKLVIYGEGNQRNELELLIEKLELAEKVFLPGYLKNTTDFLADIDVFINCSITEGMPISLLEAMRQGCHIVATNIPASRFLLDDVNVINQLCELNSDSLSNSIVDLFLTPVEKKEHVSSIYVKKFEEHYRSELMAKKYLEIYRATK